MSTNLESEDLFAQADKYNKLAQKSQDKTEKLLGKLKSLKDNNAPTNQIKELERDVKEYRNNIQMLREQAKELAAQGIISITTDLPNAKEKIEKSTDKVLAAVDKVENTKKFLRVIDIFVRLGTAIINPASSQPAKIAQIVGEIDTLDIDNI